MLAKVYFAGSGAVPISVTERGTFRRQWCLGLK